MVPSAAEAVPAESVTDDLAQLHELHPDLAAERTYQRALLEWIEPMAWESWITGTFRPFPMRERRTVWMQKAERRPVDNLPQWVDTSLPVGAQVEASFLTPWQGDAPPRDLTIYTRSAEYVWRRVRLYMHGLNRTCYGKRWREHNMCVPAFWVIEPHKSGVLHTHGLLGNTKTERRPEGLTLKQQQRLWHSVLGIGFAKVKPYRAGVSDRYVCKQVSYVAKDVRGATGWVIFGQGNHAPDLPYKAI